MNALFYILPAVGRLLFMKGHTPGGIGAMAPGGGEGVGPGVCSALAHLLVPKAPEAQTAAVVKGS